MKKFTGAAVEFIRRIFSEKALKQLHLFWARNHAEIQKLLREIPELLLKTEKYLETHGVDGVLIVMAGAAAAVFLGQKVLFWSGVLLKVIGISATVSVFSSNPDLASFALLAAQLGLSVIILGAASVFVGVVSFVMAASKGVRLLWGKIENWWRGQPKPQFRPMSGLVSA